MDDAPDVARLYLSILISLVKMGNWQKPTLQPSLVTICKSGRTRPYSRCKNGSRPYGSKITTPFPATKTTTLALANKHDCG